MRKGLLFCLLLALASFSTAQENLEETPKGEDLVQDTKEAPAHSGIQFTVTRDEYVLASDISQQDYAIRLGQDKVLKYFNKKPDSMDYMIIDLQGNVIHTQSIFESGYTPEFVYERSDQIFLDNQNLLIVAENQTGAYTTMVDPQGNQVGNQELIAELTEYDAFPQLHKFADGRILVLLFEFLNKSDAVQEGSEVLTAVILNQDGSVFQPKFIITNEKVIAARSLDQPLELLPIIWIAEDHSTRVRTVDSSGVLGEGKRLATGQAITFIGFQRFDCSDNALIAWTSALDGGMDGDMEGGESQAATQFGIHHLILNIKTLEVVTPAVQLEGAVMNNPHIAKAIILHTNNVFYTWHSAFEGAEKSIGAAIVDSLLNVLVPMFVVNDAANQPDMFLLDPSNSVHVYQNKYIYVGWNKQCTDPNGEMGLSYVGSFLNSAGKKLFEQDFMGECKVTRSRVTAIQFPDQSFLLSWRDPRGGEGSSTLYARIVKIQDNL